MVFGALWSTDRGCGLSPSPGRAAIMSAPQSAWWAGNPQLIDERAGATGIGDRTRCKPQPARRQYHRPHRYAGGDHHCVGVVNGQTTDQRNRILISDSTIATLRKACRIARPLDAEPPELGRCLPIHLDLLGGGARIVSAQDWLDHERDRIAREQEAATCIHCEALAKPLSKGQAGA